MTPNPRELRRAFERGENVSARLRGELGSSSNTSGVIELSYDVQAGSYIAALADPTAKEVNERYAAEIASLVRGLSMPDTLLEAGVGEGTTLEAVLRHLGMPVDSYGFDISWSRTSLAQEWLQGHGAGAFTLFTGDLLRIPLADNSIDLVYTSHSVEPNGGREAPILRELLRVARNYVVLIEPSWEFADASARARMEQHGYCRNLRGTAETLGFKVIAHEPFPVSNPRNPTAVTVIAKPEMGSVPVTRLVCPRYRTDLVRIGGAMYSPDSMIAYPVLGGIPCLRVENGVLASRFPDVHAGIES
jgi:SAM-dependent methyltransferase